MKLGANLSVLLMACDLHSTEKDCFYCPSERIQPLSSEPILLSFMKGTFSNFVEYAISFFSPSWLTMTEFFFSLATALRSSRHRELIEKQARLLTSLLQRKQNPINTWYFVWLWTHKAENLLFLCSSISCLGVLACVSFKVSTPS